MTEKTKDAIRSALFEAGFVLLGVLLALGANEWRQARADRHQTEQALASILQELANNRAAAAESQEYHRGLVTMLAADHGPDWSPGPRQFPRGFILPARLSRTAWDSASATGAVAKMDFDDVVELSAVYAQQERYENQARSAGEILYGELYRGGTDSIARNHRNLVTLIAAFDYREQQLVALYDDTLSSVRPTP